MKDIVTDGIRRKIQNIELNMLITIDSICKTNGINYFIVGGTLLGAVRHKGFIPWDDDIDIGMLREDYDKFIRSAQSFLPSHLFLQTMYTDSNAPYNFAKIRNSDTTFIETSTKDLMINHGIYIDIFPFDYYPENRFISWKNNKKITIINHKINTAFYSDTNTKYTIVGKIANIVSSICYKDVKQALIARDQVFRSVPNSKLITNYCGAWGNREIVPAKWLSQYIDLEFEGHYFKAPIEYDKYLRNIYGNYMELPPLEKRVGHHYAEVIDTEKPYTFYINDAVKNT